MLKHTQLALALALSAIVVSAGCIPPIPAARNSAFHAKPTIRGAAPEERLSPEIEKMMKSAQKQSTITVGYDREYRSIGYPMGDVPQETGVCTDVVIRAFRAAGTDLQERVHNDMKSHFGSYPHNWGNRGADANIDHRRVPNLETFFKRKRRVRPISSNPKDYSPGDAVSWNLGSLTHIGIVTERKSSSGTPLIAHNIGSGTKIEDVLFAWKQRGHFRWF